MKSFISGIFLLLSAISCASAATVQVSNIDSGWYTWAGFHSSINKNYYADESNEQRNYFVFDVSGIDTNSVTGASLTIFTSDIVNQGTFELFDVSTPSDTLSAFSPANAAGEAINDDLGTGKSYGSIFIGEINSQSFINITLGQSFIDDLKASSGTISLGGTFTTSDGLSGYAFANSGFNTGNVLTLQVTPVPEANSSYMLFVGLLALMAVRRNRFN